MKGKSKEEDLKEAKYYRYRSGKVSVKYYGSKGNCHRENGPAIISYSKSGEVMEEFYYLDNKLYSEEDYKIQIEMRNSFIIADFFKIWVRYQFKLIKSQAKVWLFFI